MSKRKPKPDPRDLLLQLYQAKHAALEARRKRADHAASVGSCERSNGFDENGDEICLVRCYESQRTNWCDVCKSKKPFFDDFKVKTHAFQAAVRAAMRDGKRISNEH